METTLRPILVTIEDAAAILQIDPEIVRSWVDKRRHGLQVRGYLRTPGNRRQRLISLEDARAIHQTVRRPDRVTPKDGAHTH